jgi:protein gp37
VSAYTGIEWTDATWNPIRGCSRVSEGCRNCYAERVAHRFSFIGGPYDGLTNEHGRWNGTVRLIESTLEQPLRWRKPRRIFVNSMSDLFHDGLLNREIDRIFAVMASALQHIFQVLTKRAERMAEYFASRPCPKNVWLGVSVENQAAADERIPHLLRCPAKVRFLSCEPLLGPVDLDPWIWGDRCPDPQCGDSTWDHPCELGEQRLHWVIAGGESGSAARPTSPDWFRGLRDQCVGANVPFFFKQWGEWAPEGTSGRPEDDRLRRVGKKAAGALLDGQRWQQFPGGVR